MKIQVSVKMPSKVSAPTTLRMACKAGESVESFKQRVCDVVSVPFPQQELLLAGTQLRSNASMGDSGVKDGCSIDFLVEASEATLSEQLVGLLPARPVSLDELESIYTLKCGASVGQALHMLGLGGTLGDFLQGKERAQQFVVSPSGLVQSAKAASEGKEPEHVVSQKKDLRQTLEDAMPGSEELNEEQLFLPPHKEQRMQRLEALLFCIQDLRVIDKEIEKITDKVTSRLDVDVQVEKKTEKAKKRHGSKWFKKESAKHPGRFYYVNAETGASSWKRPADMDSSDDAATSLLRVPPGLSLPVALKKKAAPMSPMSLPVPEDAEMCFDDLQDLPVKIPVADRANSLSRLAREVSGDRAVTR